MSPFRWGYVKDGAVEETRTLTPFGTAPSRQRVYQFHHDGMLMRDKQTAYFGISGDFSGTAGAGAEGAGAAGFASVFPAGAESDSVTPPVRGATE